MQRHSISPRPDWEKTVESQGMLYHTSDDGPYWDESACYEFRSSEIDEIEKATYALNDLCLEAVDHVISKKLYDQFGIPAAFTDYIATSWEIDEQTIYGRFDLCYDGQHPPKLLEYNADTPTALLEASVVQWFWLKDFAKGDSQLDQFNSIHERLIEAWGAITPRPAGKVYFTSMPESLEDYMTVNYLRDTAIQAGLDTDYIEITDMGWNSGSAEFVDMKDKPMGFIFKLYPWEWLVAEEFGPHVLLNKTRWFEPPWKMLLSSKAILKVLYEMFPESPYLLKAGLQPFGDSYVCKPIHAREGANISIVRYGVTVESTDGEYGGRPCIYQDFCPLPEFDRHYPVVGSWMVNGYACGIGIREGDSLITSNTSRFVPSYFKA